jgi:integrase
LWPETIRAIKDVIAERPAVDIPNLFLTRFEGPWVHGRTDAIQKQFSKLMQAHGIAPDIRHAGFYALRHCFSTIGNQTGDRDAVKSITGHKDKDMLARYVHGLPPMKRRLAVVNHVRRWLFGGKKPR